MTTNFKEILEAITASKSLDELKEKYRIAVKEFHPDLNKDIDDAYIKQINTIYTSMIDILKDKESIKRADSQVNEAEWFQNIIVDLLKYEAIEVEVCGWFIWLGGDTKPYKEEIKKLDFHWSSNKKKWYHKPDWYFSTHRNSWSMTEIRNKYGSQRIKATGKNEERLKIK